MRWLSCSEPPTRRCSGGLTCAGSPAPAASPRSSWPPARRTRPHSAPRPARKLAKTLEQAPAGSVLLVERQLCVLVARPSADRDLPALRDLAGALARVQRHPAERDQSGSGGRRMRCRRWRTSRSGAGSGPCPPAGRQTARDGGRYVLRAYRRGDLERARTSLKTARRLFGGLAPEPVGRSRRRGLMVQAWVPGEPLDRALAARSDLADTLPTVGRILAGVHQQQPARPAARLAGAPLDATAELLGALDADLGRWAAHLAAPAGRRAAPEDDEPVFVHGDFSVDQVVLGPDGPGLLGLGPRRSRRGRGRPGQPASRRTGSGELAAGSRRLRRGAPASARPGLVCRRRPCWNVPLSRSAPGTVSWLSETRRMLADVQHLLA